LEDAAAGDEWRIGRDVLSAQRHRPSAAALGSASTAAIRRSTQTGPNPTDRGKRGSTRYVFTGATGIPLAVRLTGAQVHDSPMLEEVADAEPPARLSWGKPWLSVRAGSTPMRRVITAPAVEP
jgi:hypothetical protein